MKLYRKVRMSSRGHYTTEFMVKTSKSVERQNTTNVTTENVPVAATTSLQLTTSRELTTPEVGNIAPSMVTVLASSVVGVCILAVITGAICCYISKRFRQRQCGITRRGRTKKMKKNAKPPSHHDLVLLETNAYNALVENIMSNPLQNTSSQHTHGKHRKKLTSNGGSPVTEPVYLVLIPDPPIQADTSGKAENHTNKSSSGVQIKSGISSSVTIPADGVGESKLYVNVSLDRNDVSAHDNVQHQNMSSEQKLQQHVDKADNQMSSAASEVKGYAEQTGTTKTDSPVLKNDTKSQVNENGPEAEGSELKVVTTDLASTDERNRNSIPHGTVYENVSIETGSKMRGTGSSVEETGSKIGETGSSVEEIGSKIGETGSKVKENGSKMGESESNMGKIGSKVRKTGLKMPKEQDTKPIDGIDNIGYEDIELA